MNLPFPIRSRQYFSAIVLVLATAPTQGQVTVFSDNYNRTALNPAPNSASYSVTATGDGGASIASNILTLTNDASAGANANGKVSVAIPSSSFSAPYNSTLSLDGSVTWNFNMQQVRSDPSGFTGGLYGVAFILAGTSGDFTTGNGYAIALGGSGSADPIRLVSYTNGIATQASIITGTGTFGDIGAEYLSIRVTYSAPTNTWSLFGRIDGTTSFANPTTGTLTSLGSAIESTYTGISLGRMGELWNFNTAANQTALFDNVSVTVPEPSTWLAGGLALGAIGFVRSRRRARKCSPF